MADEKGLTLVEVLAALLILGIVFVGFMTIFPQMDLFNQRTESKIVTMNLAKQELAALKESPARLTPDRRRSSSTPANPYETYDFSKTGYDIQVDCHDAEKTSGGPKYACSDSAPVPRLHKIHISVKEDGKLTSESFGYVELR
ncbi:type IV pilus modification PilV family protein [Sporosarcina trichiuri]|uniref:type IV pilus modification PilV family protein n=1 Tax=Sporosarcina trichiuri TaxID=3056445 RepID=UPI0025B3FA6A|nr:type II secretion system protein [Sporosarcina sp. 0.2-SM1T-5]WJY26439.1 type II secretion system protein [Sporosarcina sp. 0.2-SM1T-5]